MTPTCPPALSAPDRTIFFAPPPPLAAPMRAGMPTGESIDQVAAGEAVRPSHAATGLRVGMPSLGSEGHCAGQCIPCLMQVRWQAGKCAEPCRFGALCGRCHEPHTEEELQKIQAKMRKQKRKGGAAGAALLSAASARGTAAPVGKGAGK